MKSYINKQNLLGLLLVIGSIAINNTNNASQEQESLESLQKKFDMLIDCARHNPNGSWYRKGGWECGKYFLPLSNDKANLKKTIEATDFSEEGQRVASEIVKKYLVGSYTIYAYMQKRDNPNYNFGKELGSAKEESPNKEKFELAQALADQIPGKKRFSYNNRFLQYANFECECYRDLFEGDNLRLGGYVTDEQDKKNIIETITRHKRQIQS